MEFTKTLLASILVAWISTGEACGAATSSEPEQITSAGWWREQAVHYANEIADGDVRGRTHWELVYVLARGGDFDGARASANKVGNPQLRVYAHCSVAKTYKQKGNNDACVSELQQARKTALESANISCHSGVIQAYIEMGYLAEAAAFASEIPADSARNYSVGETAAGIAKKGNLDMALDLVEQRLPPSAKEGALSGMANACASELRLEDVEKLIARMSTAEFKNRAYVHLVQALVPANRLAEAARFATRVSDPARRAAAQAQIAAEVAKDESIEALQASVGKATTRDEKLAIYDLLFAKLIDAGDVASAEAVIDSMIRTIEAFPREPSPSKFGTFGDAVAVGLARAKYLQTAKVLTKKGDREGSLSRIARVERAILEIPDNSGLGKSMVVFGLVQSKVEIGDLSGARNTLGQLKADFTRSALAARVAVALIKSGDVNSGLKVAEMITGPVGRGGAMGDVVSALLHVGELKAAKELLRTLGDFSDDAQAYRTAGQTLMELRRGAELSHWVSQMTSNVARAYVCMGAAEALQKQ